MKIAVTGHRPERLGLPIDESDHSWNEIYEKLRDVFYELNTGDRYLDIYSGMASGVDIIAALVAVDSMNEYDRLHCILPCKDYNSSNPNYEYITSHATEIVALSEEWYKGCDSARDQYMVDNCDVLVAVWDGIKTGGVWSTIRKAQKVGKRVEIIEVGNENN